MTDYQKEVLEAALHYHSLGLSVIPLLPKDKKPAIKWDIYQRERATPEQITAWFSSPQEMNLGIVTGRVSGVAVIDLDGADPSAYPPTATVKTAKGWHLYYRVPDEATIPSGVRVAENTDHRGEGGYVVAPPSIHPDTNNPYVWTETLTSISDLPPFPSHMFREATREVKDNWMDMPTRSIVEGERNKEAASYAGGLLRGLPTQLWKTAGWGGLKEVNHSFSPPLEIGELRTIFKSIERKETTRRKQADQEGTAPSFEPFTLSQLYAREFSAQRWLVQDLIPFSGITALSGDSNSYKSFLAQSLAMSIVSGAKFLGHFPTTRGKVLIVDEENHESYVKQRFETLGLKASDDLLFLSQQRFRADDTEHIESLRAVIEKEQPVLVVIDSLIDVHAKNENDAPEMNRLFLSLKTLLGEDRAIVIIHHHRKAQLGQSSRPGQSMRGSSGIQGAVDAHLAVDRKGPIDIVVTQDKLRVQPQLRPFKVSVVSTEEGYTAFAYQGEDNSREEALLKVQDAILDALDKADHKLTIKELIQITGASEAQARAAAAGLVDSGEVEKTTGGHNTALYERSDKKNTDDSSQQPGLEILDESAPGEGF